MNWYLLEASSKAHAITIAHYYFPQKLDGWLYLHNHESVIVGIFARFLRPLAPKVAMATHSPRRGFENIKVSAYESESGFMVDTSRQHQRRAGASRPWPGISIRQDYQLCQPCAYQLNYSHLGCNHALLFHEYNPIKHIWPQCLRLRMFFLGALSKKSKFCIQILAHGYIRSLII